MIKFLGKILPPSKDQAAVMGATIIFIYWQPTWGFLFFLLGIAIITILVETYNKLN